jgi:hypothetical protein
VVALEGEEAWAHNRFSSNTSDITLFTFSSNQGLPLPLYQPPSQCNVNASVPALGGAPCGAADVSLHGGSNYCASHVTHNHAHANESVVGSVFSATGMPLVPLPTAIR